MTPRPEVEGLSPAQRERLILAHVPLLKHIVGRMSVPRGLDRDDLYGFGMLGLIGAADAFDVSRNLKFSTYAYPKIRGAILDELRRSDHLSRGDREQLRDLDRAVSRLEQAHGVPPSPEDVAQELGLSQAEVDELLCSARSGVPTSLDGDADGESALMGLLDDPSSPDPIGSAEWNECKQRLARAIEQLPDNEKSVITLYYAEGLLLREISEVLGVTESRVSQIHSRAIFRLNRSLTAPEGARS